MSKLREMLEKKFKNTINLFSILSLGTKYGSAVLERFFCINNDKQIKIMIK